MAEQRICYLSAFPNSVELLARVNEGPETPAEA